MENFLKSLSSVDELIVICTLLSHGFRLTKWKSNSCKTFNSLPKTEYHQN